MSDQAGWFGLFHARRTDGCLPVTGHQPLEVENVEAGPLAARDDSRLAALSVAHFNAGIELLRAAGASKYGIAEIAGDEAHGLRVNAAVRVRRRVESLE